MISEIITRALNDEYLTKENIATLFDVRLFSDESALIISAGRKKSNQASAAKAEVHGQLGLNIAPCPGNCKFCSFAAINGIFKESEEISAEEGVQKAINFENHRANAIFVMATAQYPFKKYVEMGREFRRHLKPETVLVSNFGDLTYDMAKELKNAGFDGIYHAVRLGEGIDTVFNVENRLKTFINAREAGLQLGTCLEPVGTEHTTKELVEKTIITRDAKPVFSGAARRIPITGTELEKYSM